VLEIRVRSVLDEPEAQATPSIILPGDIRSGE